MTTEKNDNTHVIALLVFYDNRKLLIFKVLIVVVYLFIYIYVCVDFLCLKKNCHTEGSKIISLIRFQEFAFMTFCLILCIFMVLFKKLL